MSNFRIVTKVHYHNKTLHCIEYLEAERWIRVAYECYVDLEDCERAMITFIKNYMKDGVTAYEYTYYNTRGEKV